MAFSVAQPWSSGEHQMHQLLKVPEQDNPTSSFLAPQAASASASFPLLAIGVLDSQNRPWTSLWGGAPGFSQPLGGNLLGTRTIVDGKHDPVVQALMEQKFGTVTEDRKGMMISSLPIDLESRKRVKLFGRVVAGALNPHGDTGEEHGISEIQLVAKISQSLGNCPKYLNQKAISSSIPRPQLLSSSQYLTAEAIALVQKADLFFLTTANSTTDMDTNHRGGPPGFLRIINAGTASTPAVLIYPEYSGNRLYQSLGNLVTTPTISLCVPDFATGDVLYLTGRAEVLIGRAAEQVLPRSNLAVSISVAEARFVAQGLPFRGTPGAYSPYNPRVRVLASEGGVAGALADDASGTAVLVEKTDVTPSISRYRFRAAEPVSYRPGQWVALDFAGELDEGYSHMRDDDPGSLNDDFVRTFTVSSHPEAVARNEFEITTRLHGPVTAFLKRQNMRVPLEVPLKGFGGDLVISQKGVVAFVAGGVGITPLLGQLPGLKMERLRLIWVIRLEDTKFVRDVLEKHKRLAPVTSLFFTSGENAAPTYNEDIVTIKDTGAKVEMRRLTQEDLVIVVERWYLCAGEPLRGQLVEWLAGKTVVYENFDY